jgi:branched-chain amino acid aminotransferase
MSANGNDSIVYHVGEFVRASQAVISVDSLAMRYGLSVFEGIRGYRQPDGTVLPFMLEPHLRRLKSSLRLMHLPDPGVEAIPGIINELIARNAFQDDIYIRPSVHAVNSGDLDVSPNVGLTVRIVPMGRKKWLEKNVGMKATISAWQKQPNSAFPSSAKCIAAYAGPFTAARLAKSAGFDVPLLLNQQGYVTEAPTSALFLAKGAGLIHPPTTDGVLPSVTAFVLSELANQLGVPVREQHIRTEDVIGADEAMLCGTGLEVVPIESLDHQTIRHFNDRPITRSLTHAYFELVRGGRHVNGDRYDV